MAFGVTSFDELNKLVGMKRSMPFADYFAPMKITDEQKRERIRLAEALEEEFLYMLSYMFYAYPTINESMVDDLRDGYIRQLEELGIAVMVADDIARNNPYYRQAEKFAIECIDATQRHKDDPYYYSADRARLNAEDQANFIGDIKADEEAIANGMKYKTWNTVGDNRVRFSHEEVEGLTIPVGELFVLQGGLLAYPHDTSHGCDVNEVSNCRCSLTYSDGE